MHDILQGFARSDRPPGTATGARAIPESLPEHLRGRKQRRGRQLHSGAEQGQSGAFRHQPRDHRRPRLRSRRQRGRIHHPVDLEGVRVRAGAGNSRRRAGRSQDRRRAERRGVQFDPSDRRQPAVQRHGQCRRDRLLGPDPQRRRRRRVRARARCAEPLRRARARRRRGGVRSPNARPATATAPSPICCATIPSSTATSTRCSTSISGNAPSW